MARKRPPKQTEQPTVTIEALPRDAEELTSEEAEAAKGGWFAGFFGPLAAKLQATATTPAVEPTNDRSPPSL